MPQQREEQQQQQQQESSSTASDFFTFSRSSFLLANLVGVINPASPTDPTYTIASNYLAPLSGPTADTKGKRKADTIEDTAGSWTVFSGHSHGQSWWKATYTGSKLQELAMILDHSSSHPVELKLKKATAKEGIMISASIANVLAARMHGRIPVTTFSSHRLLSPTSPSQARSSQTTSTDWETASETPTQLSELTGDETREQIIQKHRALMAKYKRLSEKHVHLHDKYKDLKKDKKVGETHYRNIISTDKQKASTVSAKFSGGKTLQRSGFVPRNTGGRGTFVGSKAKLEESSDSDSGEETAHPTSSQTQGPSQATTTSASQFTSADH
ncbi:hypothetical protein OC846_004078 [Tilletia horrida]|uniref:Uncharacterized protein n=1 Tax=Tilletia horrida TaxID=155126 RepID=A0AAN6JQQ5_9BASI|nr:hypothetical protein OC846_004078 [Tilletia horrida]KAK0564566.1 hypothetical protein OC861_004213 [Tilletia horrida]